jgi:formate hydrogenlyase transcriptional activator
LDSRASPLQSTNWLAENGPKELELLFRAVLHQTSAPILLADDQDNCYGASAGVAKLLGIPREEIIGRAIEDLPAFSNKIKSQLPGRLNSPGKPGGKAGLGIADRNTKAAAAGRQFGDELASPLGSTPGTAPVPRESLGSLPDLDLTARANILPMRHRLVLLDEARQTPSNAQDYALYLLDKDGRFAAWYAGAERIYGYESNELIGQPATVLYRSDDALRAKFQDQLNRVAAGGHAGAEGWQIKKDGTLFWASVIVMALNDDDGGLQGFALIVRDFSNRHESSEKLRRGRSRVNTAPAKAAIAAIISGEFDQIPEANDAFLELVGYSREDLQAGRLQWPDLTPAEYLNLDELAHEEGMLFGACTPFEKELIRKDGTRIPVLIATAVLKLVPFRWISFVQDLRERDRLENVEDESAEPQSSFDEIIGNSALMKRVMAQVEIVAPTDATVLILGETGTGKELVARALHKMSPRRNLPFITLNCAAIPTGLLESELFGYERGAFTGALSQKIGRFEMAHRGTLFLDEVGDIPMDLQPKLLRALQEKSFERLGGTRTIPIDVRLVAATNRNLTQMMGDKLFRSDLYYRLKVFPITTPPLRDRPEDIPVLTRHFTRKYAAKMNRQIEKIPSATMQALVKFRWPGNVRELENFIERAVILSRGPSLRAPLAEILEDVPNTAGSATLEQVEREHIVRVLKDSGGVVTIAATRLGLQRTTLNAMMRKLGISRKDL